MIDFIKGIDAQWWLIIAGVVYLILPANSPIKAFINRILGPILGPIINPTPTPGPVPGPVPTPGPGPVPGFDISTLLQLLMNLLLKAKAEGDVAKQEAILSTIEAVQTEHAAFQRTAIPPSLMAASYPFQYQRYV